jgi:hypothetical protein
VRAVLAQLLLAFSISGLSIAIIGGISKFQPGDSSTMEQAIVMTWLATGMAFGLLTPFLDITDMLTIMVWLPLHITNVHGFGWLPDQQFNLTLPYLLPVPWSIFIAPIWGLVLVGKMLYEWEIVFQFIDEVHASLFIETKFWCLGTV